MGRRKAGGEAGRGREVEGWEWPVDCNVRFENTGAF